MNKEFFLSKIDDCAENLDVKHGVLLKFFRLLIENDHLNTPNLVYELEIPKTHFGRILNFFSDYLQPKSDFIRLKPEYKQNLESLVNLENNLNEKEFEERFLEIYSEILKNRPAPKRELDQFYATSRTIIKRALFLHKNNEIYRRKILLLGDDDHTSIALSLLNTASRIHVVDVDDSILESIKKIASKYNLNIETSISDFRYDRMDSLKTTFDTIFTDPPYTTPGIDLFVDKALTCLRFRNSSIIYFCYGNSPRATERILSIQKKIMEKELLISSIEKNFNQYVGADSIGNGSSLYGCVLTPATKMPKFEKKDKRIYTHE